VERGGGGAERWRRWKNGDGGESERERESERMTGAMESSQGHGVKKPGAVSEGSVLPQPEEEPGVAAAVSPRPEEEPGVAAAG
jgi:hypothetical protein